MVNVKQCKRISDERVGTSSVVVPPLRVVELQSRAKIGLQAIFQVVSGRVAVWFVS
jgi:hypothetical protein